MMTTDQTQQLLTGGGHVVDADPVSDTDLSSDSRRG